MGINITQLIPWQDDPAYREEIERIQRAKLSDTTRKRLVNTTDTVYALQYNPELPVLEVFEALYLEREGK